MILDSCLYMKRINSCLGQMLNKCFLDFDLETIMQTLLKQWGEKDQTKMTILIMIRLRNSLKIWDDDLN